MVKFLVTRSRPPSLLDTRLPFEHHIFRIVARVAVIHPTTDNDLHLHGVDSANRVTRAELTGGKSPAESQDVEAVLEAFASQRLLTLAAGTVELSHEALLTAWPLLRDTWLADTHADRIIRTRLHTTAAEWDRHSRDRSYLYTGSLLQAATGTATRIGADPARDGNTGDPRGVS